jgi:O-antigen ligase
LLAGGVVAIALALGGSRAIEAARRFVAAHKAQAAGMAVAFAAVVALTAGRFITKLSNSENASLAVQARLVNWKASLELWLGSPVVGHGLGSFKLLQERALQHAYPQGVPVIVAEQRFFTAHSEPLQALVELGVVGLGLAIASFVSWLLEVRSNEALSTQERFGIIWGMSALVVASCFGFPFHIPVTAMAIVTVLAVGLSRPAAAPALAGLPRLALAALTAIVVGGVSWQVVQRAALPLFDASRFTYAADALQANDKPAEEAVVLSLVERNARFKGEVRMLRITNLLHQKRYQEALDLYRASDRVGLGLGDRLLEARALYGLGRKAEARKVCEDLLVYFPPKTEVHKRAKRYIKRIDKEMKAVAKVGA